MPRRNVTSLANLGPILAANACSTLKSINLESDVGYQQDPALRGLDYALQDMAGNNVLEELELCIKSCPYNGEGCMDSGDLENLDRVLTEHGAFPKLRRVSIELKWQFDMSEIEYWSERDDEFAYLIPLDKVTREFFPRLYGNLASGFSFHQDDEINSC